MKDSEKKLPLTTISQVCDAKAEANFSFVYLGIVLIGATVILIMFACVGNELPTWLRIATSILFSVLIVASLLQLKAKLSTLGEKALNAATSYDKEFNQHSMTRFDGTLEQLRKPSRPKVA